MPPITTKQLLTEKLNASYNALEAAVARLTPEQRTAPGVVGEWSARDVLAHLAEWEEMHIGWLETAQRGEIPAIPAPGYTWQGDDVDRLNHAIYEKHCHRSWDDVLAWFRDVHARFMAQYEQICEEDLFRPGVVPFTNRLATWYNHYAMHDGWGRKHIHDTWVRKPRAAKKVS